MGSMCVLCPAVTQAQRQQLEEEEAEKNRIIKKSNDALSKKMDAAQSAADKYAKSEKLNGNDLKAIIACVLPLSGSDDKPSYFTTKPKINERLEKLPQHWSKYFETNLDTENTSANIDTPEVLDEVVCDEVI